MQPQPIIIDCDPGIDDAIALLLAFASPAKLDLLGITTVAGNVPLALTTRNACLMRELASSHSVPVYAGCAAPLVRAPVDAGHFHGASGLGNLPVSQPDQPASPGHAARWIVDTLRQRPSNTVTLVVMGPMTNIAQAIALDADAVQRAQCIVAMGGARCEGGNITASAEFNIFADPHAARRVFQCGCPIVMLGLDATHQVRANPAHVAALRAVGTRAANTVASLLEFALQLPANDHRDGGVPLHDPCTIAWLLDPAAFTDLPCHIDVETESPLTIGHTAVEFRVSADKPTNARWVVSANGARVFELLVQSLRHLP